MWTQTAICLVIRFGFDECGIITLLRASGPGDYLKTVVLPSISLAAGLPGPFSAFSSLVIIHSGRNSYLAIDSIGRNSRRR